MNIKIFALLHFSAIFFFHAHKIYVWKQQKGRKRKEIFGEFFETGLMSGMCCELVVKFQKLIYKYFLLVCPQYEVIYSKYDKTTAAAATLNPFYL